MAGYFTWTREVQPICQLGMSDKRQPDPDDWVDVSCHVHEAELFRGRERFNDRFQPGTASITFSNDDGWGDLPGNPSQVINRRLRPGRQIRVGVRGPFYGTGGATIPPPPHPPVVVRWLWYGYIDQATPAYDPVLHDVVTCVCIDALGEAGQVEVLTGPNQGVNEVIHERMHRVLTAAEWWYTKRAIKPGTALMQGTTLGSRAIDLMTVAADSAGGVVYGDLVGNVVYKDIDWMLYDPAFPPDGEIGNCRGPVPPGGPPYHDPRPGPPVYDPLPPGPTHPPGPIRFCLGPSDKGGRVIERGAHYSIYILRSPVDGKQHLYYEEYGRIWDLGVWEPSGGCVEIHPPVPDPTDPSLPPVDPPTRTPIPCLDCPPSGPPEDATEPPPSDLPPELRFGVELLGWSDGNASVDRLAVTGITPGPDRLLVLLACALADDIPAGSLKPWPLNNGSIEGGGLEWFETASAISGGSGAESYGAVAVTGRTDPGTFDVDVDWSEDHRSRQHIVTVWGVHRPAADMFDRLKAAGDSVRAFTWDRVTGILPDPVNPPGTGPFTLPFDDTGQQGTADIVIAQSLAENHTAPYGATFDDTDGVWWTPDFAGAPTVTAAAGGDCDTFDRADGPLGDNWTVPLFNPITAVAMSIVDGAAVAPEDTSGSPGTHWGMARWVNPKPVDQWIEMTVDQDEYGFQQYYQLTLCGTATNAEELQLWVEANDDGWYWGVWYIAADGIDGELLAESDVSPLVDYPATIRFETLNGGVDVVVTINGDELASVSEFGGPLAGELVGFGCCWTHSATPPTGTQPRIDKVCSNAIGGGGPGWCDEFDRAGPLIGTDWTLGPLFTGQSASPPTLIDGHLEGDEDEGLAPGAHVQVSQMTTAPWPGDQSVDVTFANIYQEAGFVPAHGEQVTEGDCMVVAKANNVNNEHILAFVQFGMGDPGSGDPEDPASWPGACYVQLFYVQPSGAVDPIAGVLGSGTVSSLDWQTNPAFTVRLEAGADRAVCYLDDQFVCEGAFPASVVGDRVGFGFEWRAAHDPPVGSTGAESYWVESVCVNEPVEGVARKCSWVAGYRPATPPLLTAVADVNWSEVNSGPDDIQSCQAAVVIEPLTADDETGTDTLTIGGSTMAFDGPIYGATQLDADGDVVWTFDPADYL